MKSRALIFILLALCLVFGVLYFSSTSKYQKTTADQLHTLQELTNQLATVSDSLTIERQRAADFSNELAKLKATLESITNQLTQAEQFISELKTQTNALIQQLTQIKSDLTNKEIKISELETRNKSLDEEAAELKVTITNLTAQIAEVQRKLAAAESDKAFLQSELKRLMSEKAELERKLNDLEAIRARYKLLKEELIRKKRLEWMQKGTLNPTEKRGAEYLVPRQQWQTPPPKSTYDLNVEIDSEGKVRVINPPSKPAETNK